MTLVDFWLETRILHKGFKSIAGVDEAGRGALFGPVVAAAVILPDRFILDRSPDWLEEIDDSKLLSSVKREMLAKEILSHAAAVGIGSATHREIDKNNIYWASLMAMRRAIQILTPHPEFLLVDGFRLNGVHYPQLSVPQGDKKSKTIAAASIVAKVFRDEMMNRLDKIYKGYALSRNKGYGTREHFKALKEKGPTPLHRRSFNLKKQDHVL